MTSDTKRRLVFYSVAAILVVGLGYGGFVYTAEPDVGTLVNSAEVLAQCGALDEAIRNAERALRQEPDNRYAHVILGYCYGERGDFDRALDHYERALAADDDGRNRALLRLYHAEMLCRAGRFAEAGGEARAVLAGEDGSARAQARLVLARAQRGQGDLDGAAEQYLALVEAVPADPDPLVLLAEVETERDRIDVAADLLTRAVALAPRRGEFRLRLAGVRLVQGDRDGAVRLVREVAGAQVVLARRWLEEEPELADLRGDPELADLLSGATPAPAEKR